MFLYSDEYDAIERSDLRRQDRHLRLQAAQFSRHPHDPEFPDIEEEPEPRVCLSCGAHTLPDGALPCGH